MKALMTAALVVALIALLSACAPGRSLGPQESLLVACAGYDATLRSLAGYRAAGQLSDEKIATVDRLRPTLNNICLAEEPPSAVEAAGLLDIIEQAMWQLILIERNPAESTSPG